MNNKPKVVVTCIPRWSYGQWFILGLQMLAKQGQIDLQFRAGFLYRLSLFPSRPVAAVLLRVARLFMSTPKDGYLIEGYIAVNGVTKYFCIDTADSPYTFDDDALRKVCCYFKMQCPVHIEKEGFALNDSVRIPFSTYCHVDASLDNCVCNVGERKKTEALWSNLDKVKPLMVGPRYLSPNCNAYSVMYDAYKKNFGNTAIVTSKTLMCYFGNSLGPVPKGDAEHCDYDNESNIMKYFGTSVNHPNEKRGKAADYIAACGDAYDSRVITQGNAETGLVNHPELVVPLKDFCNHIANFQYNLNISGYRMSIPNRFIESFMVGTAILTDKLALKWYKPFDKEVVETVPMGYMPMEQVNWDQFKNDIERLPIVNKDIVLKAFKDKWAPEKVAQYIVKTVIDT